ncbi:Diphthamide biosynthesis protein 3 [Coemansia sp. RSA 552]|nr:Diphthamide biosynthesis protein 3 [Coemansia sp. RSA 552]
MTEQKQRPLVATAAAEAGDIKCSLPETTEPGNNADTGTLSREESRMNSPVSGPSDPAKVSETAVGQLTAAAASSTAAGTGGGAHNYYDEVEIEDMEYDEDEGMYTYPCPCGDQFQITIEDLQDGEEIAQCPSCSLLLKVVYDRDEFQPDGDDDGETIALGTTITVV